MYLSMDLFESSLLKPLNFLNLEVHFISHIWEFEGYISSDKLLALVSLFSFWNSHTVTISLLDNIP